jgi:hypothetical protein
MRIEPTEPGTDWWWTPGGPKEPPNVLYGCPARLVVHVDDGALPWDVTLELVAEDETGAMQVERLCVERRPGGPPASAAGVRRVPIGEIVTEALRVSMQRANIVTTDDGRGVLVAESHRPTVLPDGATRWVPAEVTDGVVRKHLEPKRRNGVTDEMLADALAHYERAVAAGRRDALVYTAKMLGVSRPTATRWVQRAKEQRDGRAQG